MIDNNDIAILTRLNTLAERHGLKPTDFVATVGSDTSTNAQSYTLRFEAPADANKLQEERFGKMLKSLGVAQSDDPKLTGDAGSIFDALGTALELAPKPRGRF